MTPDPAAIKLLSKLELEEFITEKIMIANPSRVIINNINRLAINPFNTTDLFLYPLKTSEGTKRNQ